LDKLVVLYHLGRLRICNGTLSRLMIERDRLIGLKSQHSMELQEVVLVTDEVTRKSSQPLRLNRIDEKINWLRDEIRECEQALVEIEQWHREHPDGTPTNTAVTQRP